ncbi:glycoside hydrolase family 76 protein [Moniliophthora roreri MCA 2997]|uniref:Glycoside hydrolase family 76 protein n=1 Tax=Moniliophthora roreri (strain MCA 2997) TaxID=1381753 RepID=V2WTF6_MONRO|nr:glycoside hydrolase family 76 protein [Moniliophthora roreri MCA 2997]
MPSDSPLRLGDRVAIAKVVLRWCLLSLVSCRVAGQMAVPQSWTKTTVNSTRQQRIDIASAALDMVWDRGFGAGDDVASFYSQLAEFDIMANQTKYEARVNSYFLNGPPCDKDQVALHIIPCYNMNGYAATRAYAAYKNEQVLDYAVRAWEFEKNYTLLDSELVPPPFQNSDVEEAFNTRNQCEDRVSLAGGLMFYPRADMVTSDNGRFLRLSGLLAEVTQNNTYIETAQKSADFMLSQSYNDESLLRWQTTINMSNPCQIVTKEEVDPWNAGYAIAGLAILSSVSPGNETIKQRLKNTVFAATSSSMWHDGRGVMTIGSNKAGDADLLFGLFTAYARESADSALSSYLQSYIANQYNAVLDQATYSAGNQIRAARVLVAGIGIPSAAAETTSPPPPPSSSPSSPSSRKSPPVGGIVGGVLGGVLLIALVGASIYIIRRRRQLSRSGESIAPFHESLSDQGQTRTNSTVEATVTWRTEKSRSSRNELSRESRSIPSQSISVPSQSSRNEMTTEELVQMLNQRLQPERWNESESPPSYAPGAR